MRLDPTAVTVMVGLMALLCSSFLIIVRLFFPKSVRGLNQWLMGSALLVLGGLCHGFKEITGSLELVVWANGLVIAGILLCWNGLQRFYNKVLISVWLQGVALGFVVIATAWFTWVHNSFAARLILVSGVQTVLFVWICIALWHNKHRSFGLRLIMSAYGFAAIVSMLRLSTAFFFPDQVNTLLGVSLIQILYLASYSMTWLLSTMGFIALIIDGLQSKLVYLASHDVLTGVLNRGAFFAEAQKYLSKERRHEVSIAVLLLDVDHFKRVNDRYGHQEGDRVLVAFCQLVQQCLGKQVLFGRYGGEEFVALLVGHNRQLAQETAEQLCTVIRQGLADRGVTVSIGVAMDSQTFTIDELLGQADEALYRAKKEGRNQVVLAA